MDKEQLELAQKKAKELIDYEQKTQRIRGFIDKIQEDKYLYLMTTHQDEMWHDAKMTFELIGTELIELLESKYHERRRYISQLTAEDLVKPEDNEG